MRARSGSRSGRVGSSNVRTVSGRALHAAACVVAIALASCRPEATKQPQPDPHTARTPATTEPTLADRIDPGRVDGLMVGMPAWALHELGIDRAPHDAEALRAALQSWRGLPKHASSGQQIAAAVQIGMVLLALEQAAPAGADDPERMVALAQLYGAFDMPLLFDRKGVFGQMLAATARVLAQSTEGDADARARELLAWLPEAFSRLPGLHRRAVARLLRDAPTRPELPDLLEGLAAAETPESGNPVALRREALRLRGRYALPQQRRALAQACFDALDLACGDAAMAAAGAGDGDATPTKAEVATERERAARAIALAKAKSLDERLERARLLRQLGRVRDAHAAFASLRRDAPKDARVLGGEIDAQLLIDLDFDHAYETLVAAPEALEHREPQYLELSVGVRAMHLAYTVLPTAAAGGLGAAIEAVLPLLPPLRRDVDELAAAGVDVGVVLQFVLGLGDELLPIVLADDHAALLALARGLLPRAQALRARTPDSPHSLDVLIAAAQFSSDGEAARAALAGALPTDPALARRVAMTRLTLALTFDRAEDLDPIARDLDALPPSFPPAMRTRMHARLDAVRWRMVGDTRARDRAIERYGTLLAEANDTADVPDLSNLSALLLDTGRQAEAAVPLARALELSSDDNVATIQAALMLTPIDLAALERVTTRDEGQAGLAARRELAARTTEPKARARWRAAVREAEAKPPVRARVLPNAAGLGADSSLQIGVGYSTATGLTHGLQLNLDAGPTPRLFPRTPAVPSSRGRAR